MGEQNLSAELDRLRSATKAYFDLAASLADASLIARTVGLGLEQEEVEEEQELEDSGEAPVSDSEFMLDRAETYAEKAREAAIGGLEMLEEVGSRYDGSPETEALIAEYVGAVERAAKCAEEISCNLQSPSRAGHIWANQFEAVAVSIRFLNAEAAASDAMDSDG